jgi:hypothetical protein
MLAIAPPLRIPLKKHLVHPELDLCPMHIFVGILALPQFCSFFW